MESEETEHGRTSAAWNYLQYMIYVCITTGIIPTSKAKRFKSETVIVWSRLFS